MDEFDSMSIYHLRDLFGGHRARIRCEDVKVYKPPQYPGLAIDDMLKWAQKYPVVA